MAGRRDHGHAHDPAVHQPDGHQDLPRHHVRYQRGARHHLLHGQDLRSADAAERLLRQRVRAVAHGRRAGSRLPRIEEDHPRKRAAGLRPVLLHDHRRCPDGLPHRTAGRLGRQRARYWPVLDEHPCSVRLRHHHPAAVPVPGAAGSALAAQCPHDHEHQHVGLRLHPGPDGHLELRLLRRHRRCALPVHA